MKLPVFCVGIYTSQHPVHLAGCAGLFLALGNWVPKNRRLPAWCWKSHPWGNRIQSESHEFSLRMFFLEKYIFFLLLREHTVGGRGDEQMFMLVQDFWKSKSPRTLTARTYFMQTNKPATRMPTRAALHVPLGIARRALKPFNFTHWD